MKNNTTLKSVLNRQFVAMNTYSPMANDEFECRRTTGLGTRTPRISFKPFDCVIPAMAENARSATISQ